MRALLARHRDTGAWFQRIDTGDALVLSTFAVSVSAQFRVALEQVKVEERTLTDRASYQAIQTAFTAGLFEGSPVTAAPVVSDPRTALRTKLDAAETVADLRNVLKQEWKL